MKITSIIPELLVTNIEETIDFYQDILNFKVTTSVPEKNPFFVILSNGNFQIMLFAKENFSEEIPLFKKRKAGGTMALYIGINDIKETYEKVKDQVEIIQTLYKTDYGGFEFSCVDCNGYVLIFHE